MLPEKNITRKKFLHTCGSVVAGGSIAVVSAVLLRRMYAGKNNQTVPCNQAMAKCPDSSGCIFDCPLKIQNSKLKTHN